MSSLPLLTVLIGVVACGWAKGGESTTEKKLPRLLDLGSKTCIPCKKMAPILEELKLEYAGKFEVEFIDVNEKANAQAVETYKIDTIPTQIFFDASGKELERHVGFFSKEAILAKWKELKIEFKAAATGEASAAFERLEPLKKDERVKDHVCYMCDKDIDAKSQVSVQTGKGDVRLCSPHCYFIMYSCLIEDKAGFEKKVKVTDAATGNGVAAVAAAYVYGLDEKTGRPTIAAFADRDGARRQIQAGGGSLVNWQTLQAKELATRCGFCDRSVYPEDAALVKVEGLHAWGCCSHCALGVAARTGKDIEVHQPDGLSGEMIVVKTLGGRIASIEPKSAVAWFGQKKTAEGKFVSAGCFHQGFFVTQENLKKWVEGRPCLIGREISIAQALADKMKLAPEQIKKACKIGECAPK